jgi:exosortase H (IPTLxxWG-CTERM-specific)
MHDRTSSEPSMKSVRVRLWFVAKFILLVVAGYVLIALNQINDWLIVPFTEQIARVSAAVLQLLGQPVTASSTIITSEAFSVAINNGCNGVEAMILLGAAILAFPASISRRVGGVLGGIVLIQLLNLVRVVSLYLIGRYHYSLFQLFHTTVWQIVIITLTIVMFLLWSQKIAAPRHLQTVR